MTRVWFDPPHRWRVESAEGTPIRIENESDEYRIGDDGVAVHESKVPGHTTVVSGDPSMLLFQAHRMWWSDLGFEPMYSGEPSAPVDVEVRGRPGWRVVFQNHRLGVPTTVVIDRELGVTLSWAQGQMRVEMADPILDEEFDPALFTWDGPIVENTDLIAEKQRAAEAAETALVTRLGAGRRLDDFVGHGNCPSLLIRTDFGDDSRWRQVALAAMEPVASGYDDVPTFEAVLTCIDNRDHEGLTVDDLLARIGDGPPFYVFVADAVTLDDPEMPILVVDTGREEFGHEPGRTFRVIPSEMWGVENNLSIANMDFREFADAADPDGVFRGLGDE